MVLRIAVPREAVKIAFRNPRRPRVGILYLSSVVPSDLVDNEVQITRSMSQKLGAKGMEN